MSTNGADVEARTPPDVASQRHPVHRRTHAHGEVRRRVLMGRIASVLFLASGGLVLATLPILPDDANVAVSVAVGVAAVAIGAFAWLAPWDRWPQPTSLVLVPPAFALIAVGNMYGGSGQHTYGVFFVIAFVWIGLAHRSWTSVAMAPLAAVAYVIPLYHLPGSLALGLSSALVTIPACVIVGETLSWGSGRLSRTEEALQREREVASRLTELDEMRTSFMAAISHELRTPITICRGHLEVLEPDAGPGEIREAIGVVLDELDRMGRLVDDITTVVRGDDPSYLRKEPVPLVPFSQQVASKVKPFLNGRLTVASPPAMSEARADPRRLEQALVNLLHNAAVHTPPGTQVELRIRPSHRAWRFEVEDHGPGLRPGHEQAAFERFVHGPASRGSGLGLPVVRSIARAHGGEAGVDNRPGEGATFWIRIPD